MAGVPGFDPSRLFSQLQNTGLAVKDNPLYQLLYLMIQTILKLNVTVVANSGGGGGGGGTTIINEFIQQLNLSDSINESDSNSSIFIPGPQGAKGDAGAIGIPGQDGLDGEGLSFLQDVGKSKGLTPGSVVFIGPSSFFAEDNANFSWDDTNNILAATKIIASTYIIIGNSLNDPVTYGGASQLYLGFDTDTRIFIDGAGTTAFGGITTRRARGTQASRSDVIDQDTLGQYEFQGFSGSSYFNGASFLAKVDGTVVSGQAVPTAFAIATNNTNALPAVRMVVSAKGYVGIHKDPPDIYLHVLGSNSGSNPANSGSVAVGAARIADAGTVSTDFGAYPSSPFSGWIQVHDAGNQAVNYPLTIQPNGGGVGIGTQAPTAALHLPAGKAAASSAPLKLTAGILLTTPELGAMEFTDDGTTAHLYITTRIATVVTRVQIA